MRNWWNTHSNSTTISSDSPIGSDTTSDFTNPTSDFTEQEEKPPTKHENNFSIPNQDEKKTTPPSSKAPTMPEEKKTNLLKAKTHSTHSTTRGEKQKASLLCNEPRFSPSLCSLENNCLFFT
jgi:hypothetical protein